MKVFLLKAVLILSLLTLATACKIRQFVKDSQLYHSGKITQTELGKKYYRFFYSNNDTLKLKNLIDELYVAQKNIYFNGVTSLKYRGIKFFLSNGKLVYTETSYVDSRQEALYLLSQDKNFSGYVDATANVIKTEFIINDYGSLGHIIREYVLKSDSLIRINQYNIKSPNNSNKENLIYIKSK